MNFLDRLQKIDRRWVFLILAVAVTAPLLFPLGLKILPTSESQTFYRMVDSLPEGSVVMVSFDFGPSAAPELLPVAESFIRHAFRKNLKVITLALWPDGLPLSQDTADNIANTMNKIYGKDYVTLGYKSGIASVISQLGEGFHQTFPLDARKNPLESLPLMERVKNYDQVSLTCVLAAGTSIDWWIGIANGRYKENLVAATTAVMASDYYPYLQTQQIQGLLGGLKPAGEYQWMVDGENTPRMIRMLDSQSLVHLAIIFFVMLGNVGYLVTRNPEARRRK